MTESPHNLLEQHFDTAFAAPDGIKKLRELILTLAMQGKLVAQDLNDPPASELLKQIEAEKQRLVKSGKIKQPKPLPSIRPEEVPYELPEGWLWVRLGDIGDTNIGLTYSPADVSETGIPVLRSNNIQNGMLDFSGLKRVSMDIKESVLVQNGDLLICARNGSRALVGKTALIKGLNEKMAFGAFMAIFRSPVNLYLFHFINSPLFRRVIDEVNTMTINQITQDNLKTTICPLPPFLEQHRIVTKIDQLMAKCDELEALRKEREEKRRAVHTAAIKQLLDTSASFPRRRESSNSKELGLRSPSVRGQTCRGDGVSAHDWNFIQQHFGELYTVKENVAELRKTILQLAVMGRLVPQDPSDPPASELLKQIEAEKQQLVKAGKIKQPKPLPPIKPEEVPYQLPQRWEWVRLSEVTSKITDGDHKTPPRISEGYRLLSAKNVRNGFLDFDNCDFISEQHYLKSRERCLPEMGDLLIVSVGGTIGRTSLVPGDSEFALVRSVALIKPLLLKGKYLKYSMDSEFLQASIHGKKRGGAQPCLYLSEIQLFLFSLPPLSEQHRIVAKIDQLMTLCDQLEQQIDAASTKQRELLDAVMSSVS